MTDYASTVAELRALVAAELTDPLDHRSRGAGALQRLCRAAARDLPALGVGVSLFTDADDLLTAAASNAIAATVEGLQFSLGEGPGLSAYASRHPVLIPELSTYGASRWPLFSRAAHEQGVRAVFAFPLQIGAGRLGTMGVYRACAGALPDKTLARAVIFTELALEGLLDAGASRAGTTAVLQSVSRHQYEVYQAQGMVMVQLGVSAHEALARLRGHAFTRAEPLNRVAEDVIRRRITMERDLPPLGSEELERGP